MKNYSSNAVRNIVLMGHSGCGKTTITEAALFTTGAIKRFGKVADGNTTSDYDSEEIKRKVSISTSVIPIEWKDTKINFLDTPGYFDFAGEVASAISVADEALIVVSAKSGVEVGTEKAYEYAKEEGIPRLFFINQMDDENADFERVLGQLTDKFGSGIVALQIPFVDEAKNGKGFINVITKEATLLVGGKLEKCDIPADLVDEVEELRANLVETAAGGTEELMEKYFEEGDLTIEEIYKGLEAGIMENGVAPVVCGAAASGYGIEVLLNTIKNFLPPSVKARPDFAYTVPGSDEVVDAKCDPDGKFKAFVFKTISDPYVGRLNIFKVLSGTMKKDGTYYNPAKDCMEKAAHIYVLRGKEQIEVDELCAGDIGALSKLANTFTQDTLCDKAETVLITPMELPESVHYMAIVPKGKGDEDKISNALNKIKEEDLTVKTEVNPETKQTLVYGLGEQHLDVLVNKLKNKYKIEVELIKPIIPYRETIKGKAEVRGKYKKQSGGHGQFGDVVMVFEPSGDLSTPYVFEEKIFGGSVPKQYFPAVEKGLQEAVLAGVLAKYPVVGLKATLIDGSYHPVDSSEMAFKMATSVAYKEGVPQAKPTILEPIASVKVTIPDEYTGDVMGDINKRRGRILNMGPVNGKTVVSAEVPLAEMYKYCTDLRSMTRSLGSYTYKFERYEEAPVEVQQKVIEARLKELEKEAK